MPLIYFFYVKSLLVLDFPYVQVQKGINSLDICNIYVYIHITRQYKLGTVPETGEVMV